MSKIEWISKTWNPTVGCTKVSAGCKFCFAEKMHDRLTAMGQAKYAEPFGVVKLHPESLTVPLKRQKPTTYFVNSMSDLFHEALTNEEIAAVFGAMAACPQNTFQVLTKRAKRMRDLVQWVQSDLGRVNEAAAPYLDGRVVLPTQRHGMVLGGWPIPNVWLGVSVEDQQRADERIPHLLQTPAAVRFLSLEPLLEAVDLGAFFSVVDNNGEPSGPRCRPDGRPAIDLAIAGGEIGPRARPCNVDWLRSLRDQCAEAGVAYFLKQLGARPTDRASHDWPAYTPYERLGPGRVALKIRHPKGGDPSEWPKDLRVREMPEVRG